MTQTFRPFGGRRARAAFLRPLTSLVAGLVVVACASATAPVATSPGPSGVASSPASPPPATPRSTTVATVSPSPAATPTSTNLDIRGSAREIGERIVLAPGPNGTLFVAIPHPDGAILVLFDDSGRPRRPGWPITVPNSTGCGLLFPVDDGSVRVTCDGTDLPQFENDPSDMRVFAFDASGHLMAGWPIQLRPGFTGVMVGDELTLLASQWLTDTVSTGVVSHEIWVTAISADGSVRVGEKLPRVETCCGESWGVAPDGAAYGSFTVGERDVAGFDEVSEVTALDLSGEHAGWPVTVDGSASAPAFGPDGQIVLTVGRLVQKTSRVVVFDRGGEAPASASGELPIAAGVIVTADGSYECGAPSPIPPIVTPDGTIFVMSEADPAIFALDPSLELKPGWPYSPATPRVYRFDPRSEPSCGSLAPAAVGADSTLYLPLRARDETVGGSLAAVGPDGRARPGWPVELKRPGAEFWSVVVGSDGTVIALAVEPEAGDTSSASILAIAPDSTVRSITTILEP
jgi:hypothetical protein